MPEGLILLFFIYRYHIVAGVIGILLIMSLGGLIRSTFRYIKTDRKKSCLTDYCVTNKQKETAGDGVTNRYRLCVKHNGGLYLVYVPVDVYEETKTGEGEHLRLEKLYFSKAENKIEYLAEHISLADVLLGWTKITLYVVMIIIFLHLGNNVHFSWQ